MLARETPVCMSFIFTVSRDFLRRFNNWKIINKPAFGFVEFLVNFVPIRL